MGKQTAQAKEVYSLLGVQVGGVRCRRKVSVSCRILAIILLPIKTGSMLLGSVMQANPAPTITS